MVDYDIKRGHYSQIEGDRLEALMEEVFGNVSVDGDRLVSRFGAMDPIAARIVDKKTLAVEITTRPDASDDMALESIRAKNAFLQAATGFNTKERSKRLQKKAKEGKL